MELHAVRMFYDNRRGLVELEDDVLSIVRQVRELYDGKVTVHLDDHSGQYYFVEHCEDQTERLIFACDELDARALERLLIADSRSRVYSDAYERQEREQDAENALAEEKALERVRDAGERLAWALEEDGKGTQSSILVSRDLADG